MQGILDKNLEELVVKGVEMGIEKGLQRVKTEVMEEVMEATKKIINEVKIGYLCDTG